MQAALSARALQLGYWHRVTSRLAVRDSRREIRTFTIGALLTAMIWSVYPVAFLPGLSPDERAVMTAIITGIAGGSTTVLAPSLLLAVAYQGILLLPVALGFFALGGQENAVLGILGIVCFLTLSVSARIAHLAAIQSLRLNLANRRLMDDREREHQRTATANEQLRALQKALEEANTDLEHKVTDRTEKLLNEIRERQHYEQELSRLASTDPLTGLGNRASLIQRIHGALAGAGAGSRLAILFIDLDDFKEVNDVRGHHAGDLVLAAVASRLLDCPGQPEDLARWGGDEFVVVLRDLDGPGRALELAALLRARIAEPIDIGGETVRIDATIGISLYPDHGDGHDTLIRAADLAMYAAKQQRGQRVRLFDPLLAEQVAKGHFLGQCLSQAIADRKLTAVFQPIVSVTHGHCLALEALVRWNHPEHGPVPPSEFIPMAERSGDILALGRWMLMEACRAAVQWPGEAPPAVSVNVSATQIIEGRLVEDVLQALEQFALPPHRLHLELTETAFAGDNERVAPVLAELRGRGVRISLDDFGTGFSSLAYLRRFPIDTIKIDKSFVGGMEAESESIVRAIVSMAHALGYDVVAEGVEVESQMEALRALGVEHQQGFLFARPMPAGQVAAWLEEWSPVSLPSISRS